MGRGGIGRSACAAGLLLACAAAAGEGAGEPRPMLYETATVIARPLERATATVTVLEREEIAALGAATMTELIRQIAGLDVTTNGSPAGSATAQVRGGDPNFTLVLVDGVPLNDATDTFGGSVNLNSLPVEHVERIEVVRGPVSSVYGSTGLSGVIHIITRRPPQGPTEASFSAGAGSASFVEASAALGARGARHAYSVGATWITEEGRIADDSFDQVQLQGNADLGLGSEGALLLTGRASAWKSDDYPDASGGPVYGSGETRTSDHEELSLGAEWSFGAEGRRQRLHATLYAHDLDRESPAVEPLVPQSSERTRYRRGQASWSTPLLGPGSLALTGGVVVGWEEGRNDSVLLLPPDLGGPVDGSYGIDRATGGAFLELVGERGRLLYEVGARIDVPEGFDAEISPRAGVAYRVGEGRTRLRASVGRAFKLPSFFVLASPPALGGNPDLAPEVSLGADAGVEHRFERARLTPALTLFAYRFEDLVDFDFDTFRFVNRSAVTSRGFEVSVDWQAVATLRLRAHATYQDVENRDTGEPLRNRPEWVGGALLAWSPLPVLDWSVDLQAVSDQLDEQLTVPERDTVPGFAVLGSVLAWRVAGPWQVRARVDNVLDREYETLIGFPGPARSFRVALRYASSGPIPSAASAASRSPRSSSRASGPEASSAAREHHPAATATAR